MKQSFIARDASGKQYTIRIYYETGSAASKGSPTARAITRFSLKTDKGEHVNPNGPGKYTILTDDIDDIEVTTDDPDAPQ